MIKNKKGLSNIVATVLIVLLALAAVAIVWGFLLPMFRGTGTGIDLGTECLNVEVVPTKCLNTSGNFTKVSVTYQLTKEPSVGSGISMGAKIILGCDDGTTVIRDATAMPNLLGTKTEGNITCTSGSADEAKVAAVLTKGDESETCAESAAIGCISA